MGTVLVALRKGHELGSRQEVWHHPSALWISECEKLVGLEDRLPALLRGEDKPKGHCDRLALGHLCYNTRRYEASARFLCDAIDADPDLAADRRSGLRYNAACAAALAGSGKGNDDPKPDAAARAALREKARGWLDAELDAWARVLKDAKPEARGTVAKTLDHWKADPDLAGVRDAEVLGKLPEDERKAW